MVGVTGTVIISRLVTDDGGQVVIEVGAPTRGGDGAECVFRIDDQVSCSRGGDELAAVYAAVTEIGQLLARADRDAARLRFALSAELGFADPASPADPPAAADLDVASGEIIARRVIEHDGRRHVITVERPARSPVHQLALCPFTVDDRPRAVAGGWDGMGAFLTAVGMIGCWLNLPADWPTATLG
ncbi:hypothetical protein IU436_29160 [Nocardia farcinica]|uniref:hypothetical protein n=1 Tax=Nocardia farcinica TaxID=37329 RepID=UPI00189462ED|nr:hypothetical protein [Nocardia farcinica]MBF6234841.1 hypothetical protein [Nocardia farcinica]MBF6257211.1 hypothetical protein [Nocardia farcinica]MBF6265546.1 hypothetical protein [Nocardia farcinica]MBF6271283.1 hypothetical protein [Nocardia farcinica]MBF6422752.1 hypothetical protein [Nocardia farcinica]